MPETVESKHLIGEDARAIRLRVENLAKLPDFVGEVRKIVKKKDSDGDKNESIVKGVTPFVADFKNLLEFVPEENAQSFNHFADRLDRSFKSRFSTPKHKLTMVITFEKLAGIVLGKMERLGIPIGNVPQK